MRATLEFDLNDFDDRIAHLRAIKSNELAMAIWEFVNNSRRSIEERVDSGEIDNPYTCLDVVYDRMIGLLDDGDININNLVV